jgi:hypothetical protein
MPKDHADGPFDPAPFTASERRLARDYLLGSRSCRVAPTPVKVTVHDAWQWRPTAQGGEAARSRGVLRETAVGTSLDSEPPADDAWFACSHAQFESMFQLPQPDHLIEPPDVDEAREE